MSDICHFLPTISSCSLPIVHPTHDLISLWLAESEKQLWSGQYARADKQHFTLTQNEKNLQACPIFPNRQMRKLKLRKKERKKTPPHYYTVNKLMTLIIKPRLIWFHTLILLWICHAVTNHCIMLTISSFSFVSSFQNKQASKDRELNRKRIKRLKQVPYKRSYSPGQ